MRGAPGSLIGTARQELRKKLFPRRFSPSARTMDSCTSSSTFRVLRKIVRAAAQVAALNCLRSFFDTTASTRGTRNAFLRETRQEGTPSALLAQRAKLPPAPPIAHGLS